MKDTVRRADVIGKLSGTVADVHGGGQAAWTVVVRHEAANKKQKAGLWQGGEMSLATEWAVVLKGGGRTVLVEAHSGPDFPNQKTLLSGVTGR